MVTGVLPLSLILLVPPHELNIMKRIAWRKDKTPSSGANEQIANKRNKSLSKMVDDKSSLCEPKPLKKKKILS